ncbi:hypothetical protein PILCRDRAFT_97385 [Piloderma croceum F 1598]|uniref:Heme haloperoxidase family profile domain-containing protein n=1 Tax=Piloderma croceum (strain F 1598) TaxID=765440 RepID=A0A0C3FWN2_PILCF|nr:hypothetical protein PILCRDRAFT_97385 [Piloderma croceum F 1598]
MSIFHKVCVVFLNIYIVDWDSVLVLVNLVLPKKPIGKVVPQGHPGANGKKKGDSRPTCPALNHTANHGIILHDGNNLTFPELTHTLRTTYNFAPTLSFYFSICGRFISGTAAMTSIDQSKIAVPFVEGLLNSASSTGTEGKPLLMPKDLSAYLGKRRADARAEYTTSPVHRVFGSFKYVTFLLEERLPEGWEPKIRSPYGLTIGAIDKTVLGVELGAKEK